MANGPGRSEYSVQNADCRPLARGGKTDWCGYSHHAWCGRTRLMSGTLLAFDFGTKSIGVAVGQRITGTARPLPAIKAQDGTPDWNIIERLLKEWQPDEIIVGLPLNMDGTEQPLTARARKFANRIHGRFGVEVKLHDERLSTVEARSGLFEQGGYRALNKGKVDSASAVIILESYFEQGY
ncbi:putative Holliday junction resolvase [Escherichia coli K-12]|nr:ORF_o180; was also ORF_o62p before splice [Escherichia coli str. K-12 substr. MG1655]CQR82386.1 putative Holliday junction resolvase [Escherichia coli K-12]